MAMMQHGVFGHVTTTPGFALDLATGAEMTWDPVRIARPGPWAGHIPFAFWLVKALRPAGFVELGTHSGNSYFAFCQAMAAFCPSGRAYAVDTWEGDAHAGAYDAGVHADVVRFNDAHFAAFSTLIRDHFDGARSYFADGSIDLLHIDGLHTYEAVRHDFETWRSALSTSGVVVLHDINVRERGFGVWRLWEELRAAFPHFTFHHAHGLGVAGVGQEQAAALKALFALGAEDAALFRCRIAARGEAFQRQAENLVLRDELAAKDGHIAGLEGRLVALDAQHEQLAAKDAMVATLANLAAARAAALSVRDGMIAGRDALAMQLARETQARLNAQGEAYEREMARLHAELAQAQHARAAMAGQVETARAEGAAAVQRYVSSTSWRVTRPMRVAMRLLRERRLHPAPVVAVPPPTPAPAAPPVEADAAAVPSAKLALRAGLSARLEAFLSTSAVLVLPRAAVPEVSIVLVLHNQAELTFGCLGSIAETLGAGSPPVEVVILDNASTDRTGALLERVEGATVIRSEGNLHFLKGVNQAAKSARGRVLLLLNNDALLLPGGRGLRPAHARFGRGYRRGGRADHPAGWHAAGGRVDPVAQWCRHRLWPRAGPERAGPHVPARRGLLLRRVPADADRGVAGAGRVR